MPSTNTDMSPGRPVGAETFRCTGVLAGRLSSASGRLTCTAVRSTPAGDALGLGSMPASSITSTTRLPSRPSTASRLRSGSPSLWSNRIRFSSVCGSTQKAVANRPMKPPSTENGNEIWSCR